jgi:hypothetical protein
MVQTADTWPCSMTVIRTIFMTDTYIIRTVITLMSIKSE